jgi:hypothetical protein
LEFLEGFKSEGLALRLVNEKLVSELGSVDHMLGNGAEKFNDS